LYREKIIILMILLLTVSPLMMRQSNCREVKISFAPRFELYDVSWLYAITNITVGNTTIPGGTTALMIALKYISDVPASNLFINFTELRRVGKLNETCKRYNDTIPANYSLTFVFVFDEVYQNISLSEYDLPMYLTFYANGNTYHQTLVVPVSVTGVPEIRIYAPPLIIQGEGVYNYTLKVENVGTATAKWVHVVTVGYPPYITIDSPDVYKVGFLKPLEEKEAKFAIRITEVPLSTLAFIVNVSYMDERTNDIYWIAETVPVVFNETPELIAVYSYSIPLHTLSGDKYVQVRAMVGNPTKKLIKNAEAYLDLPEYFCPSFPGADRIKLGSIPPGYFVNLTFLINVEDQAPPGFYEVPLVFTYDGGQNMDYVSIVVEEKVEFKILDIDPNELEIGASDVTLHMILINTASVEAKDVYVELQTGGSLKGELAAYIGNVYPGEIFDITFYADVSSDVPEGQAPLDLMIIWMQEERLLSKIYRIIITFVKKAIPVASIELGIAALAMFAVVYLIYRILKEVKLYKAGLL